MEHWTIDYLICLGLSVLITGLIIPMILRIAFRRNLFDMPDSRKIHKGGIPRLGGIAFMPSVIFAFCITIGLDLHFYSRDMMALMEHSGTGIVFLMCSLALVYLVGIADDLAGLKYNAKFAVQIIAGILIAFSGEWVRGLHGFLWIEAWPEWIGWIFTIFGIIYVINAVNLIDGIDGLASGLSAVALVWYSYVLWITGNYGYMLIAAAALGTLIAFFYFNVFGRVDRHTKIFMGDTGSLSIGLILAFLAIVVLDIPEENIGKNYNVFIMAVSPVLLPCLDVVRVFFHRIMRGRSPFLPDKCHIHHKLLAIGLAQRQVLAVIMVIDIVFICMNMMLTIYVQPTWIILIDVALWLFINWIMTGAIHKKELKLGKKLYE